MTPIIFINCKDTPLVDQIISGLKLFETRTRNTLKRFEGQRVLLAETGNGRPVVRCSVRIWNIVEVTSEWLWVNHYRRSTGIQPGSKYDWTPGETKKKVLYELKEVVAFQPFTPPEDIRHGRVWMEYNA